MHKVPARAALAAKVEKTVRERRLFGVGDTLVVAVSGGSDSVCLLDLLVRLASPMSLNLVVCHLNHLLRGADADADEAFVRGLAADYGLPIEVRAVDVRSLARERGLSLEHAGREARDAFFRETVIARGAAGVVLGHHADDQAETLLMRLIQGAGAAGLSGMRHRSGDIPKIRPLLEFSRSELVDHLRREGLPWREDETNRDTTLLRNRIRHVVMPALTTCNAAVRERLVETAALLAGDDDLLMRITQDAWSRYVRSDGRFSSIALDVAGLREEPQPVRARLLRLAAETAAPLSRLSIRHLRHLESLVLSSSPGVSACLPGGLCVRRDYGLLLFESAGAADGGYAVSVNGPGRYVLPGFGVLEIGFAAAPPELRGLPPTEAYIDGEACAFPWLVRTFRPGDRIGILGMAGTKKVKDLFIDEKVSRDLRRRLPLVIDSGGAVLWVPTLRRSRIGLVGCGCRKALRLRVEPLCGGGNIL